MRRGAREARRPHAPRWRGDFETGNLLQWSYLLNPRGLSVVDAPVAQGRHAARVEITERDLWPNGLNRVEVEYKPPRATLAEGQRSCFAWRFFLPATLSDARHQIGYWESYPSYKQIMSFEVRGETIAFVTRMPAERVHWTAPGAVTPNVWHQIGDVRALVDRSGDWRRRRLVRRQAGRDARRRPARSGTNPHRPTSSRSGSCATSPPRPRSCSSTTPSRTPTSRPPRRAVVSG